MAVVAIECSTDQGSVAVRARSGATVEACFDARARAGAMLAELERLLALAGEEPRAIERVLVGTGPGSYTSLRIAIATALGLARGAGAVLHAIPSYEVLAWDELHEGEECVVAADARAEKLYFARYRRDTDDVAVLEPPRLVARTELAGALGAAGVRLLAPRTLAAELGLGPRVHRSLGDEAVPRAGGLLALGEARRARGALAALGEVEPLYLRPFGASQRKR